MSLEFRGAIEASSPGRFTMTDTSPRVICPSIAALAVLFMIGLGPQPPAFAHSVSVAPAVEYADHFDTDVASWNSSTASLTWSERDAAERPDSGSMRVFASVGVGSGYTGVAQFCSTKVEPGAPYQARAHFYYEGDPETASSDYQSVEIELTFHRADGCERPADGGGSSGELLPLRHWREARTLVSVAPSDAMSVGVTIWVNQVGKDEVFVDNVTLEAGVARIPSATAWIESPELDGLRFQVQIASPSGTVRTATQVRDCIAETVCFGGALPNRVEVQIRIIGPRSNGYLWPVLTQLTPSEVRIWIEKTDTSERRYYRLGAALPGSDALSGYFDRRGFLPPLR